jgi:hypothetical protein
VKSEILLGNVKINEYEAVPIKRSVREEELPISFSAKVT